MARNVFTVMATVANAQGQYTTVSGFPKRFDSDSYNGDVDKALRRAKSAYHAQISYNYSVDNLMLWSVVLSQADGRVIDRESEGTIVSPEPEPTPEPEPEPEEE